MHAYDRAVRPHICSSCHPQTHLPQIAGMRMPELASMGTRWGPCRVAARHAKKTDENAKLDKIIMDPCGQELAKIIMETSTTDGSYTLYSLVSISIVRASEWAPAKGAAKEQLLLPEDVDEQDFLAMSEEASFASEVFDEQAPTAARRAYGLGSIRVVVQRRLLHGSWHHDVLRVDHYAKHAGSSSTRSLWRPLHQSGRARRWRGRLTTRCAPRGLRCARRWPAATPEDEYGDMVQGIAPEDQ